MGTLQCKRIDGSINNSRIPRRCSLNSFSTIERENTHRQFVGTAFRIGNSATAVPASAPYDSRSGLGRRERRYYAVSDLYGKPSRNVRLYWINNTREATIIVRQNGVNGKAKRAAKPTAVNKQPGANLPGKIHPRYANPDCRHETNHAYSSSGHDGRFSKLTVESPLSFAELTIVVGQWETISVRFVFIYIIFCPFLSLSVCVCLYLI